MRIIAHEPDGKFDIPLYHARNYSHINGDPLHDPSRNARAQIIHWNPDGTPNFEPPPADVNPPATQDAAN